MNQVPMQPTRQDLIDGLREATNWLYETNDIHNIGKVSRLLALISNAGRFDACAQEEARPMLLAALASGRAKLQKFDIEQLVGVELGGRIFICGLDPETGCPLISANLATALRGHFSGEEEPRS